MNKYLVVLFYKYTPFEDPEKIKKEQVQLCQSLNLKGRIIIAYEGINATVEGLEQDVKEYVEALSKDPTYEHVHFKFSEGTGHVFPKLSVKVRSEIVAARLGKDDVNPNQVTGKYISASELHNLYESGQQFYIVDMRNDFEAEVGHFENSLLSGMATFADLPKVLKKLESLPKDALIVTVCTGGVRCEKASGFLVNNGFTNVFQLYGGMHTYMEEYPTGHFQGALYTFDGRVIMGFNMEDPKRIIVGKCANCKAPSEHYINCLDPFCNRHYIVCEDCLGGKDKILCPMGCRDYSSEHPELYS